QRLAQDGVAAADGPDAGGRTHDASRDQAQLAQRLEAPAGGQQGNLRLGGYALPQPEGRPGAQPERSGWWAISTPAAAWKAFRLVEEPPEVTAAFGWLRGFGNDLSKLSESDLSAL
ncbi:hypothetical protein MAPG_09477, partial [Magnaporthiopsis poae ATCC 64411]